LLGGGTGGIGRLRPNRSSLSPQFALIGILVSVGFGYLAVRRVHWSATWAALRSTDYEWLIPALAFMSTAFFIRVARWRVMFYPARPAFRPLARALFVGYLFNNLLPMRAGEAARVVTLNKRIHVPVTKTTATILVERAYDVLSLVVLLFLIAPWLPHVSWLRAAGLAALGLALALAVCALIVTYSQGRVLRALFRPLSRLAFLPRESVERAPQDFIDGLAGLLRMRIAVAAFGLTILSWLVLGIGFWLLTLAFHLHVSYLAGLLVVIGIGLSMILPSSPAALGVFEGATVVCLGAYGISDSRALSYALVLHVLNFLPFLALAPFILRPAVTRRQRMALEG
jgi:glycosyltransferase 2 family protein